MRPNLRSMRSEHHARPQMSWYDEHTPRYNSVSHLVNVPHQTILVLDFGSQYTQLIARRLRELSVYSEIAPFDASADAIRARHPVGIILSGGPKSVSDPGAPKC